MIQAIKMMVVTLYAEWITIDFNHALYLRYYQYPLCISCGYMGGEYIKLFPGLISVWLVMYLLV